MFDLNEAFLPLKQPFRRTNQYVKYIIPVNPIPQYRISNNNNECSYKVNQFPWKYESRTKN